MSRLLSSVALAALASVAGTARATDPGLVGTWTWSLPNNGCAMRRTFNADGTTTVINGTKTVTGSYLVKWNRERTLRTVISQISTDNGGRNCDGDSSSTVGRKYLFYGFNDGTGLLMCLDEAKTSCQGPYTRQ